MKKKKAWLVILERTRHEILFLVSELKFKGIAMHLVIKKWAWVNALENFVLLCGLWYGFGAFMRFLLLCTANWCWMEEGIFNGCPEICVQTLRSSTLRSRRRSWQDSGRLLTGLLRQRWWGRRRLSRPGCSWRRWALRSFWHQKGSLRRGRRCCKSFSPPQRSCRVSIGIAVKLLFQCI